MKQKSRREMPIAQPLAVARKMVAYLLAVGRGERDFAPAEDHRDCGGLSTDGKGKTGLHSAQSPRSCGCRPDGGDQTPEALFEMFQDWQRTQTQSSETALAGPRPNDVRFCVEQARAERHSRELPAPAPVFVRSPVAPRENCVLDKDLRGCRQRR